MTWELQTAFVLGVLHSLEPGHGKSAMLAMALDPRKNWLDSFFLASAAVFSHSALILLIATATHFGGHLMFGDQTNQNLVEFLNFFGPLSLLAIGLFLVFKPIAKRHDCCNGQEPHNHEDQEGFKFRMPILLGFSIGIIPCPTIVATFLAAISAGKLSLGVSAMIFFAMGSFLCLLVTAFALKWFGRRISARLTQRFSQLNWVKLQGCIIIIVGFVAMLERGHA